MMAKAEEYLAIAMSIQKAVFNGLHEGMFEGKSDDEAKEVLKGLIVECFRKAGRELDLETLNNIAKDFPTIIDEPDHFHPEEERVMNGEIFRIALLLSQEAHQLGNEEYYRASGELPPALAQAPDPEHPDAF